MDNEKKPIKGSLLEKDLLVAQAGTEKPLDELKRKFLENLVFNYIGFSRSEEGKAYEGYIIIFKEKDSNVYHCFDDNDSTITAKLLTLIDSDMIKVISKEYASKEEVKSALNVMRNRNFIIEF